MHTQFKPTLFALNLQYMCLHVFLSFLVCLTDLCVPSYVVTDGAGKRFQTWSGLITLTKAC